MDALLEERTHNLVQKDEKELSKSEEPMIPTERKSTKGKGLKIQVSMATWQKEEKSHINEGEKEMTRINLKRLARL